MAGGMTTPDRPTLDDVLQMVGSDDADPAGAEHHSATG
jgi:hypothetical protein